MEDALFYLFAAIVLGSACIVAFSKNIMYSAFSLLFTFFGVAGLYVLLYADFIAVSQIMIYVGGILILIIFGVMLTNKITGVDIKTGVTNKIQMGFAIVSVLVIAVSLITLFTNTRWASIPAKGAETTTKIIGIELMTEYLLPFISISVLLLVALVGAALIARRKN
jgi:NADH-quinone oxidoreductase subunit J